jgi:hypothetical protein
MILCWSHEAICRPTMNEIIKCLLLMRNQVALLDKNNQEFLWMLHDEEEEEEEEGAVEVELREGTDVEDKGEESRSGEDGATDKEWLHKWYFRNSTSACVDSEGGDADEEHQRLLNHYHIMTPNISRVNSETNPTHPTK